MIRTSEFRCGAWQFSFRPGLALCALAAMAAAILLGNWQTRRAEQKLALQQRADSLAQGPVLSLPSTRVAASDYAYSRVAVHGAFAPQYTVFVDNRVLGGTAGYHVVTPFRIRGGDTYVLVNRGWIGVGQTRARLPPIRTPAGDLVLEGLAVVPPKRVYELETDPGGGPLVQNLVLARIEENSGLALQPIVIQQTSDTRDGLVRQWQRPDQGVDVHRAYALQWYAMGVLIVILYFVLNLRRCRVGDGAG